MRARNLVWLALVLSILIGCEDKDRPRPPSPEPPPNSEQPAPAPTPERLPDLTIVSAKAPGGPVAPGTECRCEIMVRNAGTGAWAGYVLVRGPGNHSGGFNGLRPGETKTAVVVYPVHGRGATYRMTFTVDPENVIRESNESNNTSRSVVIQTHR